MNTRRTAISFLICGCLAAVWAGAPAWAGPVADPAGGQELNFKPANEIASDFTPFTVEKERPTGLSWFSSQRFSLSHSLSYGVFSGSQGTQSMGVFASRLSYRISRPLTLSAEVGLFMDPSSQEPLSPDNMYLKSLDFNYRPNENFHMRIMYQGSPRGGYPGWATRRHLHDPFPTDPQRPAFP